MEWCYGVRLMVLFRASYRESIEASIRSFLGVSIFWFDLQNVTRLSCANRNLEKSILQAMRDENGEERCSRKDRHIFASKGILLQSICDVRNAHKLKRSLQALRDQF